MALVSTEYEIPSSELESASSIANESSQSPFGKSYTTRKVLEDSMGKRTGTPSSKGTKYFKPDNGSANKFGSLISLDPKSFSGYKKKEKVKQRYSNLTHDTSFEAMKSKNKASIMALDVRESYIAPQRYPSFSENPLEKLKPLDTSQPRLHDRNCFLKQAAIQKRKIEGKEPLIAYLFFFIW